uniref:uncharacterized protein LOC124057374 n=1 Tax=Scatophagus argus TaxID=75038 RepID=UPI001ED7F03E|nr:uncharacterized protein LOC124057374 [Scatophagus argus]
MMKYRAGFLKAVGACMLILMQSLGARPAPKKHAAIVPCRLKELTNLTRSLVEASLTSFDEANGKHLGTWFPGFPELQVHQNSALIGSKVQCSLLFMTKGLDKVLEDQEKNLNPQDVSLHQKLRDTIFRVNMLTECVKQILGGECLPKPSPPEMPKHAFNRKQWSHTLLKTAKDYLGWLECKLGFQISKVKGKNKIKCTDSEATSQRYLEGSGYLL